MEKEDFKPMKKITGILDILICLLLFISALYKGGFYKEDNLFVSMIICMLGMVCLSVKIVLNIGDNRKYAKSKLGTLVDICVMLLPVAYFLPVLFGKYASKEAAIFEVVRYVNFAIVYFIVRTTSNKKIYLTSIVLIGTILAILGIDEITYRAIGAVLEPLSITYLAESNSKISSTLQYANITALFMLIASIIIQGKLVQNLPNLKKESKVKFKLLIVGELFALILLQSAVCLTTSRMNILLMIVITIIYSVHCSRQKNKKSALMLILMLIAAFVLVSSVDTYLAAMNNFMICLTYVVTLVLTCVAVFLSTRFIITKPENKESINNKWVKVILVLVVLLFVVVMFIPNGLRVNDNTGKGNIVSRNIYTKLSQEMNLEIEFEFNRNNNFELHLYEVNEDFNKKVVVSIVPDRVKDNKYVRKIRISENYENLYMEFKTINSDVTIKSLKLNGKKITLSYKFMPDTMMFRLKDTLIKDANNTLRLTYYKDAIKLFQKSKLVGIGGEGFKARYQEVQEEGYISSEVHSVPLQILVEAGIIGLTIFLAICILTAIIIFRLYRNKNEERLIYSLIIIIFLMTATFDLVFSFGIMIYFFAIIIGLIIGEYKKENINLKDRYELDNKSVIGMLKIATLSVSLMVLFLLTLYSVNIYRASMIVVPEEIEDLDDSYTKVGLLENKIALDKYNLAYLNSLLTAYDKHIDMLKEGYVTTKGDNERFLLETEINNYIVRQKEIADYIIQYEYYNKYALEKVARCYLKRYISYAKIFKSNFKNDDIAYVFYVGYGIKLTDRLTEVGKVNNLAHQFASDIYNEYLPVIESQNQIIKSEMLQKAIEDMKQKQDALQNSVK